MELPYELESQADEFSVGRMLRATAEALSGYKPIGEECYARRYGCYRQRADASADEGY